MPAPGGQRRCGEIGGETNPLSPSALPVLASSLATLQPVVRDPVTLSRINVSASSDTISARRATPPCADKDEVRRSIVGGGVGTQVIEPSVRVNWYRVGDFQKIHAIAHLLAVVIVGFL